MADSIMIKSGALGEREEMPELKVNELGYRTDEDALYIGTKGGNVRLCGKDDIERINALMDGIITRLESLEQPSEGERG